MKQRRLLLARPRPKTKIRWPQTSLSSLHSLMEAVKKMFRTIKDWTPVIRVTRSHSYDFGILQLHTTPAL
jgi:hypothetical protein